MSISRLDEPSWYLGGVSVVCTQVHMHAHTYTQPGGEIVTFILCSFTKEGTIVIVYLLEESLGPRIGEETGNWSSISSLLFYHWPTL